ncbi:hypothetical protein ACHQM5_011249 [Ranunculus cassubicifolius]
MAMVVDQQPTFKHFCKICKKGFGCGRALGGHMRAHGIGDENGHLDDDENSSDCDDKPSSNKRMNALRTNPNRLKSCRMCANCGKEFTSWKSFLEHGKCRGDDVDSIESRENDERRECGWFKGKRTKRSGVGHLSEEEDLANCLVMLSSAQVDPVVVDEVVEESSCASASREDDRERERDRAYFIAPIRSYFDKAKGVGTGIFECKACKKTFNSHQALGGHRASHKKVKGCFAAKLDDVDETLMDENDEYSIRPTAIVPFEQSVDLQLGTSSKRKSKVHECSICHRVFSSGQALGGHKRCHWITSSSVDTSTIAKCHQYKDDNQFHQTPFFNKSDALDLNIPASNNNGVFKQRDPDNHLGLNICLQSWPGVENKKDNDGNAPTVSFSNVDEEVDSKVRLAKLNDLKDLHMNGDSSPWLQVGIGSASKVGGDP